MDSAPFKVQPQEIKTQEGQRCGQEQGGGAAQEVRRRWAADGLDLVAIGGEDFPEITARPKDIPQLLFAGGLPWALGFPKTALQKVDRKGIIQFSLASLSSLTSFPGRNQTPVSPLRKRQGLLCDIHHLRNRPSVAEIDHVDPLESPRGFHSPQRGEEV